MINIELKNQCCGCEACANACPQKCIAMKLDSEGFRYPVVDSELCISCGLCELKCHLKSEISIKRRIPAEYYAAYHVNKDIVINSSSGGVFWALVEFIMSLGNTVVYGATCENGFNVTHERADNITECLKFRKSKYLQSHIGNTYRNVENDLKNGKKVLFSGTPCQVAALYGYLNQPYSNLYTVEVICHGVPSEVIYAKHVKHLEKTEGAYIDKICWRDKECGWSPNHISYTFSNGKKLILSSEKDDFQYGFLRNYYLRPSCYECKYAKLPRIADVSLADFWHYSGELSDDNENCGISAVIISSDKGKELWENANEKLKYHLVDEDYLKKRSRHVWLHPEENPKREKIFKNVDKKTYKKIVLEVKGPAFCHQIKKIIKRIRFSIK